MTRRESPFGSKPYAIELHRFPLYYLTVVLGLRAARTLLEIYRSKSYDSKTQFTHVSRHLGPEVYLKKKKLEETVQIILSQILLKKNSYLASKI